MAEWYKTRVRFRQLDREENKYKTESELYLHRAETYGDVEQQVATEMTKTTQRLKDYKVKGISEGKFSEVVLHHLFNPENETEPEPWFLCKVEFSDFKEQILITASDVIEAHKRLTHHLKKSQIPFTIKDVDSTKFLAVFDFEDDALIQDYRARVDWMEPQYQRAEGDGTKEKKKKSDKDQLPIEFENGSDGNALQAYKDSLEELRDKGYSVSVKSGQDGEYKKVI